MIYKLLPFTFTRISNKEVLVNELGDMVVAPIGTVANITQHSLIEDELYKMLVANFFLSEEIVPSLFDIYAIRLRTKKGFLDSFTALHIFVLTLRCNQNCIYCQASSQNECGNNCTMSCETMEAAVKLMFKSPSAQLTMEFQGGEPSLEVELLRFGIEKAEEINKIEKRQITYVLCTNCIHLSAEILSVCKQYKVQISTSLDGPSFIHNKNRGQADSYEQVVAGIQKARDILGFDNVSALMTTSTLSMSYPKEIIDEYVNQGFKSVFLRALNPYGLASFNEDWRDYTNRFVGFYSKALDYIIELNKAGTFFVEEFANIVLRKILTPFTTGFVDLQSPAGIINSVLVYNYDGYVYASDESRMLAEYEDYTFRLGRVGDKYVDIVYGDKAKEIAKIWSNETLAGCSDCAFKVYCGADPVRNYSTQRDMYGYRPSSLQCKKNKAIIEYIISLLINRQDEVLPIFKRWML